MERIIIGQVYLPSGTVMDSIRARFTSPDTRKAFFDANKGGMVPGLKKALLESFQGFFGPKVTDLQLRWSAKAGCGMCPCSPGFHLSGMVDSSSHELINEVWGNQSRDRMIFSVQGDGTVCVRSHTSYRFRGAKTSTPYNVCTLLTSFYKTPEKAKPTHWLPPAPGTQCFLPFAMMA